MLSSAMMGFGGLKLLCALRMQSLLLMACPTQFACQGAAMLLQIQEHIVLLSSLASLGSFTGKFQQQNLSLYHLSLTDKA